MQKAIVAGIAIVLCASFSAHAADLGGTQVGEAPVADDLPHSWAGLYVGGSAGWGKGDLTEAFTQKVVYYDGMSISYGGGSSGDLNGAIYGAHIGYNWQFGHVVAGLEASVNGTNLDGCTACSSYLPVKVELEWYATAVARLGYAEGNWLFYGLGGVAWAHSNVDAQDNLPRFDSGHLTPPDTFDIHGGKLNQAGWTAGFGMEYAFNDRLSVRAEYSHVDLGAESVSLGSFSDVLVTNYVSEKIDVNFDVIKLGVNYTLFGPEHEVESLK